MVTDTLLIGRVADLSVYVCRADYTHKVEYTLINELAEEKKLPNLCTVINGVDLKRRKYGYYYGYGKYGKYYGYGKRYGYGYGYGQEKGGEEGGMNLSHYLVSGSDGYKAEQVGGMKPGFQLGVTGRHR